MSAPTEFPRAHQLRRYGVTAARLHWATVVLLLCAVVSGLVMVELPMSIQRLKLFNWHKWVGVTVLFMAVLRLIWRILKTPPPLHATGWQRHAAGMVHVLLYGLMLAVPLVGWAYSSATGFPVTWLGVLALPDWVPRSRELASVLKMLHWALAWLFTGLIALHIVAALKHQFIDGDSLLSRMRPW